MAKFKMQIRAKKLKAFKTKNLGQSRTFLISRAKQAFIKQRQVFVKVLILYNLDLKYHIHIEMNSFGYIMSKFSVS